MENYRGISLLNEYYKMNSRILNENCKAIAENFFCYAKMDPEKTDFQSIHCLAWNYLWGGGTGRNRREFNFETHLAFVRYVKTFDRVKRYTSFEILQRKYIANLLLKSIVEICGPGGSVGIATAYGLDGPGIEFRWGEIFRISADRPWGPPSLLYNGYRVFPGGKVLPGRDADPSPASSAEV